MQGVKRIAEAACILEAQNAKERAVGRDCSS